ncbi:MAG TPA: hypothetical protein VMV10_19090 [Pirellulales bacterium]|nr:hypothetical protein [Pirellulales bacterium]
MKANHRSIPSWDEAIGMIIATNMEARSKNPGAGGGPRGRGGRGRGGRRRPSGR